MAVINRDFSILEHIIRDYINTAEPVSSARISKIIQHRASPATVRTIMMRLDEEGYLEQPHTSAGRIPTDKAYRYFADLILGEEEKEGVKDEDAHIPKKISEMHQFVRDISEETGLFTMLGMGNDDIVWAGMDELFDEPEFHEYDVARAFASFIEEAPLRISRFYECGGHVPRVFIGKENPFPDLMYFSSVVGRPNKSTVIISIGPKRMDYEHATSVIRRFLRSL